MHVLLAPTTDHQTIAQEIRGLILDVLRVLFAMLIHIKPPHVHLLQIEHALNVLHVPLVPITGHLTAAQLEIQHALLVQLALLAITSQYHAQSLPLDHVHSVQLIQIQLMGLSRVHALLDTMVLTWVRVLLVRQDTTV